MECEQTEVVRHLQCKQIEVAKQLQCIVCSLETDTVKSFGGVGAAFCAAHLKDDSGMGEVAYEN